MIRFGEPAQGLARLPLTAVLGTIYTNKLTGTLKVFDCGGTSVPFVFWFKRGFPCHSYSRDAVARLGEQLDATKRPLVATYCRTNQIGSNPQKQLLGQQLLRQSLLTMEELQAALTKQLSGRLLCCAATDDTTFDFDEGMDEFGVVPLSSPLLNPLEVGARAATVGPHQRMHAYLLEHVEEDHVRLARDRRIPPAARRHLADTFVNTLGETQDLARILATPSRMRTLAFLHAFGFIEALTLPPENLPQRRPETTSRSAEPLVDALSDMARLVRNDASHYELLSLPFDADRSQVKLVYRHVAFLIHPDRVPADRIGESKLVFPRLVEAYHDLAKERLRVKYDYQLVTQGRWHPLGSPGQMETMITNRLTHLHRIGLTTLASEYTRMLGHLRSSNATLNDVAVSPLSRWW
jgi:hypothetical protein